MINTLSNSYGQAFNDQSKWEALSMPEIDALLEQYPFFSFLHLLKARKNKFDGLNEDVVSFKKTTLYFNNIPWLLYQYNQRPIFSKSEIDEIGSNQNDENTYPIDEILENSNVDDKDKLDKIKPIASNETLTLEFETTLNEILLEDIEITSESNNVLELETEENTNKISDTIRITEELLESKNLSESNVISDVLLSQSYDTFLETSIEREEDKDLIPSEPIIGNDTEDFGENDSIPFENTLSGDYFATQGIHVDEEENQDTIKANFTTNSFSNWLRLMQKIKSDDEIEDFKDENEDPLPSLDVVEQKELDIYTETMADIYINQGLKNKAIQIFEKLSLINPSKSAYFTSRINKINTI